jgi:predicted nucleic acid-binding protein
VGSQGILIDTSVLVAAERGQLDFDAFAARFGSAGTFLAAITASELLHGVHRLRSSQRKTRAESFVETILARTPVVPFDLVCARVHARIGADLARQGVTVGAHDLMIGATAFAYGFTVAARDRRSFGQIPGLDLEPW